MKIKPYIEKLNSSPEYLQFKEKHSDAFLIAGFFILDFEQGNNVHQIDFYVPSEKKIAAFNIDDKVVMQLLEAMSTKTPEILDIETKIDLDALKGILQDEMHNRSMTSSIKKIIAILQNIDGKKVWNLNCVLSGMEILKAHVEDSSKTVLKMEKLSVVDVIKKMPPEALQALKKTQRAPVKRVKGQPPQKTAEELHEEQEAIEALRKEKEGSKVK